MTSATTIPVARPLLDEREAEAARRVILSGWVTQGPEVAAFEREFADALGARHACAVSSCTTALHLALAACGVSSGDEVVYPAGTWRAAGSLQESEDVQDSAIVLPLFHQLTEADQNRVVDELARAAGACG